jgi:tetratricopeptide (TPR) repeat protein
LAPGRAPCGTAFRQRRGDRALHAGPGNLVATARPLQRTGREIDFQMSLGPAYIAMKGHGAPEVAAIYYRARELGEAIGDPRRLSRVLAGFCAYYAARGPYTTAFEMAEQALLLAERRDEPRLLLTAQTNLGVTAFLLGRFTAALRGRFTAALRGRFTAAQDHLEQGMALTAAQPRAGSSSQEFGVACRCHSAVTLFSLGYPEQALERSREAVQLARDLEKPFSLAFALYIGSYLHKYRREPEAMLAYALAYAEEGVALCREQNFALWLGGARAQRGLGAGRAGSHRRGCQRNPPGNKRLAWLRTVVP